MRLNIRTIRKRFFKSVTGYFDQKYDGRYFSIILKELARIEPNAFLQILKAAKLEPLKPDIEALHNGDLTIDLEWSFPDKRRKRRADLVLYREKKHPLLLAELKVEDELSEGQLDAYISFVRKNKKYGTKFLLLTKYPPLPEESKKLQDAIGKGLPVRELRIGQLRQILEGHGDTVTRMLREYLEDDGMTYETINLKAERNAIAHMCQTLLGAEKAVSGRVRSTRSIDLVPDLMKRFFEDSKVLSGLYRVSLIRTRAPIGAVRWT